MINWPSNNDTLVQLYNYDPLLPKLDPHDPAHLIVLKAETANNLATLITNMQTVLQRAAICSNENNTVFVEMVWRLQFGSWEAMNFPRFITCTNIFHLENIVPLTQTVCNKKSSTSLEEFWNGLNSDCRISSGVYLTRTLNMPYGAGPGNGLPIGTYPVTVAHNLYTDFDTQEVKMVTFWNKPLSNFLLGPSLVVNTGGTSGSSVSISNRTYCEYDYEYLLERNALLKASQPFYDSITSTYNQINTEIVFHLMIQDIV